MWTENNPRVNPSFYTKLKASPVKLIDKDDTTFSGTVRPSSRPRPGIRRVIRC